MHDHAHARDREQDHDHEISGGQYHLLDRDDQLEPG